MANTNSVQITGLQQLMGTLSDLGKKQMPFAVARAMTMTVKQAAAAETAHILAVFDKPTPFTQRAVGFTGATKNNLSAKVFIKDAQAKYLEPESEGGARGFKSFEEKFATEGQTLVLLPGRGIELNQYGNVTKAKIKRIARDLNTSGTNKRFFSGAPKGQHLPAGIYARTNNNKQITPLMVFASAAVYQKRFMFSEVGKDTITAQFEGNMVASWDLAVSTARR
jgi:hypothetical protein